MIEPVIIGAAKLYRGDCLSVMRTMLDNSVDSIVTDPPYELGFMGKAWDNTGIAYNVALWKEALRVLKPGGHLLAFSGSRTYHRMACAIEDAGFEIRDQIMWVYGSGFPKSKNLDGDWDGWGTALKPAHEPICMARKPLVGTVAQNVLLHGTGAININDCRVGTDIVGWGGGSAGGNTWTSDNCGLSKRGVARPVEGRWPANLIHDGSDEVLSAFPDAAGQQGKVTGNEPTANGFSGSVKFSGMIGRTASGDPRGDSGSAARFFYCAKTSKQDRSEGCESLPQRVAGMVSNTSGQHITRRDEGYEAKPQGNHHPTVKPTELMRYLWRLVTPPGGTGLDLFMGSGSGGKAAILEGFNYIGIELDKDNEGNSLGYFQIAIERVKHAHATVEQKNAQLRMFA